MTKQEIARKLKEAGQFDTNTKGPLWAEAFSLYLKETRTKLSMSCGSCYTRLRNWMNS